MDDNPFAKDPLNKFVFFIHSYELCLDVNVSNGKVYDTVIW